MARSQEIESGGRPHSFEDELHRGRVAIERRHIGMAASRSIRNVPKRRKLALAQSSRLYQGASDHLVSPLAPRVTVAGAIGVNG